MKPAQNKYYLYSPPQGKASFTKPGRSGEAYCIDRNHHLPNLSPLQGGPRGAKNHAAQNESFKPQSPPANISPLQGGLRGANPINHE
ncbi:MAG: hypothetical protein IH594_17190 [Bacteroidales bacterium]|nr:hypothetical protein [Bacteroidales bacterium]